MPAARAARPLISGQKTGTAIVKVEPAEDADRIMTEPSVAGEPQPSRGGELG